MLCSTTVMQYYSIMVFWGTTAKVYGGVGFDWEHFWYQRHNVEHPALGGG